MHYFGIAHAYQTTFLSQMAATPDGTASIPRQNGRERSQITKESLIVWASRTIVLSGATSG